MNLPLIHKFRLSPSGRDQGVRCDADGAFVGSVPLLAKTYANGRESWTRRNADELSEDLSAQYGLPIDIASKSAGIEAIARALDTGAVAHAQLVAVHLKIPDPPALSKTTTSADSAIALIHELHWSGLLKADWDPGKHPRWPAGSPDSQGGRFALETLLLTAEMVAAEPLAVAALLATTEPLNEGEDEKVEKTNFHHAWPKYLGGSWNQDLVEMPEALHIAYHRKLDDVAPRHKGQAYYDSLSPSRRSGLLRELASMTKEFDAEHGTHLYESMLKNRFAENP